MATLGPLRPKDRDPARSPVFAAGGNRQGLGSQGRGSERSACRRPEPVPDVTLRLGTNGATSALILGSKIVVVVGEKREIERDGS